MDEQMVDRTIRKRTNNHIRMVYQFKPTRLRLSDAKILDVELTDLVQFEEFKKKQNEKRRNTGIVLSV